MNNSIYVLHEYGAPSHFTALVCFAENNGYNVKFGEFGIMRQICHTRRRLIHNIIFLLKLRFSSNRKVVLSLAPYNESLPQLMNLLKRHEVYFFISYTCWDGSRSVYPIKDVAILQKWKEFTGSYVKHIFVVSQKTKREMVNNNFSTENRISVVNHSYKIRIAPKYNKEKTNTFIVVGEIAPRKGTIELLDIFKQYPNAEITFVGRGVNQFDVIKASVNYKNIHYVGYVKGLKNLLPYYYGNCFLILNSHRINGWEEFFGIALIEGMACGCVPITTNHTGPMEIIHDTIDGFIYEEGEIDKGVKECLEMSNERYKAMRESAINTGRSYYCENKAPSWSKILE